MQLRTLKVLLQETGDCMITWFLQANAILSASSDRLSYIWNTGIKSENEIHAQSLTVLGVV